MTALMQDAWGNFVDDPPGRLLVSLDTLSYSAVLSSPQPGIYLATLVPDLLLQVGCVGQGRVIESAVAGCFEHQDIRNHPCIQRPKAKQPIKYADTIQKLSLQVHYYMQLVLEGNFKVALSSVFYQRPFIWILPS